MSSTYLFYDLETSGLDPRLDRIMQFAAIRTDEKFNPIGKPYNLLVRLPEDTLPSPHALMVTGITPQQTISEGYSEAEFCKILSEEIFTQETTVVGFNNIRFDDEFIRALLWRNYYDPYEWAYKEGRSRWDMLDVVRMTRALRPEGIKWPSVDGKPVNKLELLTAENGLSHAKAHDALSDVEALIDVTRLIASKQPQLFAYLYKMRDKNAVKSLVNLEKPVPFVYTSGRYDSDFQKTTVAVALTEAENNNIYVYDLRHSPETWVSMSIEEIEGIVNTPYSERGQDFQNPPVKKLQYNRAPAVAPIGVLEQSDGWNKISLSQDTVAANLKELRKYPEFADNVKRVFSARSKYPAAAEAEGQLYEGFVSDRDRLRCEEIRQADHGKIASLSPTFDDSRLEAIYPNYKARNYPDLLTEGERAAHEAYRKSRLEKQSVGFIKSMQALLAEPEKLDSNQQFVLEELGLWYELVAAADDE